MESDFISNLREQISEGYLMNTYISDPMHGMSFGQILCHELYSNGLTFTQLSLKWGISLPVLGELIWDHCKRMEPSPEVDLKIGNHESYHNKSR